MKRMHAVLLLSLVSLATTGCVTHEVRPQQRINAIQATTEIPASQLLDVGVRLFDENLLEDEEAMEEAMIFPDVRRAEARFLPMQLRNTLEGTGHWGQVRVMPRDAEALDVQVSGRIIESSGQQLSVEITVSDATGRQWFKREYQQDADTRAYRDGAAPRDPFQNLYSRVANDMLTYRQQQLADADLLAVRRISELRFAADLAPYAFRDYVQEDKQGVRKVVRLPADDDPLMLRMERIRERDYALLDTINEHYSLFADDMTPSYTDWRRYSYSELEAKDEARRASIARKLLGAAAIVGGLVVGSESGTYAGRAVGSGAIFGGVYAVRSGFEKGAEVKMHSDSLQQLGESFQASVQPLVVEVEGRTLQLQGNAEEQFREWRRLLRELYENETGGIAPAAAVSDSGG